MILEKLFLSFACGLATSSGVLWVLVGAAISEEVILAFGEICGNESFDTSKGLAFQALTYRKRSLPTLCVGDLVLHSMPWCLSLQSKVWHL